MSRPNYKRSEEGLNALPVDWERHPTRDKWAVLEAPNGRKVTYHMSRRTYRLKGNQKTIPASPELMHKRVFLDRDPDFVPFGKYEYCSVEWVAEHDPSYSEWLLTAAEEPLLGALEEELDSSEDG